MNPLPTLMRAGLLGMALLSAPAFAAPLRVILVGDSTMQTRSGYGDAFCQHMAPSVVCLNLARGGRSTSSFRAEGRWTEVEDLLREGKAYQATLVLIQFGHNDQPGKPGRSTDLVTEFPANTARYAAEAKALGGTPVLVTPLTRRSFNGPYLKDDLAPWAEATRRVAKEGGYAMLDLNKISASAVQAMGSKEADTMAPEKFDHTHLGDKGAAYFGAMVAAELRRLFPAMAASFNATPAPATLPSWARDLSNENGWGGLTGTRGGATASAANISTVSTREQLNEALQRNGEASKIIMVKGLIDMRGDTAFADSKDQAQRATVRLTSNTTLIGLGAQSGFVNAQMEIANVRQVIVRNLHIQNPCDVGPVWDPHDGAKGNWNSLFDGITVSNSRQVWIDHNSFTDAPLTDDTLPVENGMVKQCHDGAVDINRASDFVTVSYNHFAQHEKNMLIGSSDKATGDEGHLRVTVHHNLFEDIAERSPRVRFGQVHTYNNYHRGDRKRAAYAHGYSIGLGKQAKVISDNNSFDIAGASECRHIVKNWDSKPFSAYIQDSGSLLNGQALAGCADSRTADWTVPYSFTPMASSEVAARVGKQAGAGKLSP
jgi:pectate lyase/lysophospholipase L1-like esterase